jgi:uncharacterized protein with GYD domain
VLIISDAKMIFIVLTKFKGKPTKEGVSNEAPKRLERSESEGVKWLKMYWTLGRYDAVSIIEGKDEKAVMRSLMKFQDVIETETLIAIPREEAVKLID